MVAVESGLILSKTSGNTLKWKDEAFPVGPFSMVLAEEKLLLAGFKDEIDPLDPWANLEGRRNCSLLIVSKQDGRQLSTYPLKALPVWNGMAAANGKVFLSLQNGKLMCMGR